MMRTEDHVAPLILKHRAVLCPLDTDGDVLPPQPSEVGPIHDPVKAREPLELFTQNYNDSVYGSSSNLDSELPIPQKPHSFTDPYLYPTFTSNEFTRLNAVWYYTRGLESDGQTLKKLDRMLDLVKQSISWEIGIIGLVDATTYRRLVTANLGLAIVPRRESTCSHTINTEIGTVFTVRDMSKDWRFQKSPPVEVGGLRSYAGTQLRLPIGIGENVVLGSLCVASSMVQQPLNVQQKKTLIRAADLITNELVLRSKMLRMKEKQIMVIALNKLRMEKGISSLEDTTLDILKAHYPDAEISMTPKYPHQLELGNGVSVTVNDFENGAWENSKFLEGLVFNARETVLESDRPVRALLGIIPTNGRALVVSTKQIKCVFDDLDTWFIDQCAQLLGSALQARALREAVAAKEKFLRTITHELRTPIHGILSSVELLSDEFKTRQATEDITPDSLAESSTLLNSFLQTIRQSGRELMTTVNNILQLNSSTCNFASFPVDYDLKYLEADVLGEVLANYSEENLQGLSIRFEQRIDSPCTSVRVDADLLKELLKCLVCNAVTATSYGTIRVFYTIQDGKMVFDVTDDGCGIDSKDQCRIFLPLEKVDPYSKGAGLGLSLAIHMANALGGELSLTTSTLGKGSTFRLVLPYIKPNSSTIVPVKQWAQNTRNLPRQFHTIKNSERDIHLLEHLERHLHLSGITKSDRVDNCLIVMNQPESFDSYDMHVLKSLTRSQFVVVVESCTNIHDFRKCLRETLRPHWIFPLTGPFISSRLDEQLSEAYTAFLQHEIKTFELSSVCEGPTAALNITAPTVTPPSSSSMETDRILSVPVPLRQLRVLLVDDNEVNLTVLKMFCKKRSMSYGTAVNGSIAVSSFCNSMTEEPYSLILLDLQMPECDGVQACKQIRAYEQAKGIEPATIFMITGQDSVADRRNSFEAGVDEFFVKPVSLKKLERAISQYFPPSVT